MRRDPLELEELLRLGRAALERLDHAGAIEILFKAQASPERDVLLARAYRHTGSSAEARKLLEPHADTLVEAAAELGLLALHRHPDEARRHFERALELGESVEALHGLAVLHETRTRGQLGRTHVYRLLRRALRLSADDPMLLQTLGTAHLNDGHVDEALGLFERVLAIRARAPWVGTRFQVEAHGNMACALVAAGRHDEALDHIELGMEACPEWLRSGMARVFDHDPDLAPLHEHPRFLAAMRISQGGTREERIAGAAAWLEAQASGPQPLPSPEAIDADARSGDPSRADAACALLLRLVSAREEIFEDQGSCDPRVRRCAEAAIARTLRDAGWLEEQVTRHASRAGIELVGLLLGSHDAALREVGAPLALAALGRWLPEDAFLVRPLLEELACTDAWVAECRPLLLAAALDRAIPDSLRRRALEALAAQGQASDAAALASLVSDSDVAAAAVQTLWALDPSQLDPVSLLSSPATRFTAARLFASQLASGHMDALLEVFRETTDPHQRERLLRALLPVADERFVPSVIACSIEPGATFTCLSWLRSQPLTDAQIGALMALPFVVHPSTQRWLAAVARGQSRWLRLDPRQVAALPRVEAAPTQGAAELVGYLGLVERADWLRAHLPAADRQTTRGIVVALGLLGDERDRTVLERLGDQVSRLRSDAWPARVLLGEGVELLDEARVSSPFGVWALERILERHGPSEALRGAVERASVRGLHNEDLREARAGLERLTRGVGV